jgi:hypothetical protein
VKSIFLFFFFLSFAMPVYADEATSRSAILKSGKMPMRIHVGYTVTTGIGNGELSEIVDISQEIDAHTFNISSNAQATGIFKVIKPGNIIRNSRGLITDKGLQPDYYSDQRANKEPSLALFDWEKKILTLRHEGKETTEPLAADTLDRLSLSYHFIFMPLTEVKDKMQTGKLFKVHVTDGRSTQLMRFKISNEKLDTPVGRLDTLVLTKLYDRDDSMRRKIWLAPDYHMIPVRIQSVEKDGLEVDKMIAEINLGYDKPGVACCKR